jgi:hypothetical protein
MTVEEILKATGINIGDDGIGSDTLRYDGWSLPRPRILSSKPAQHAEGRTCHRLIFFFKHNLKCDVSISPRLSL